MSVIADYAQREGITVAEAEERIAQMRMEVRLKRILRQPVDGPLTSPEGPVNEATLRARFCAVAWAQGATYPQLSALFKISRQAIQNKVNRILDPTQRASMSANRPKLSYEQVEKMWEVMKNVHAEKVLKDADEEKLPPFPDKID